MIIKLTPDWYFYILLFLSISAIWIKTAYPKFLYEYFYAAISYPFSNKIYYEAGITRKRAGALMTLIYIAAGSMYIFSVIKYYNFQLLEFTDFQIIILSTLLLILLILFRVFCLKFTAFIFHKESIIKGFIFHFYLYNKLLGLILIPFLFLIPYTQGILQIIFLYLSFLTISLMYIIRIIRVIIYIFKNDFFIFYLFLYLCAFEILPYVIMFKLLLSLNQGS